MVTPGFEPTHVVPRDGAPAWEAPDPERPTVPLDPLLPVQVVERLGDWARVLCANGWSAWVDGRRLVSVPVDPPAADGPPARTADPRPLLARAEQALAEYRAAVEALAAGTLDGESFRTRTRGRRVGVVVDGESVWLHDARHGRWLYADGDSVSTYAVDAAPRADAPEPAPEPPPRRPPEQQGHDDSGGRQDAGAHPPTRVVPDTGTHPPTEIAQDPGAPPPTRVVQDPGEDPPAQAVQEPGGHPPAPAVHDPAAHPAAQLVQGPAGAAPTQVAQGTGAPAPSAGVRERRAEAPADHPPTQVVTPDGP